MNQQLSWRTIVGYSLGDVANNFAFAMGALFLLSYYTTASRYRKQQLRTAHLPWRGVLHA